MTDIELNLAIAAELIKDRDAVDMEDWSGDISAAWKLLEEAAKGYNIIKSTTEPRLKYCCRMWFTKGSAEHEYGETAPEAICRTYLRYKKHEI